MIGPGCARCPGAAVARVLLAMSAFVAAVPGTVRAAEPSQDPQPRVVQEMHTAAIDQIRADARHERLVTTSYDKTLRIWRLADLRLLRTVALPSEPGPEGTPYAVAISADGRQVYTAGYTGYDWQRASHIYRIDADTGRITGTIGRFENDVVTALDLSPDGRRLAVGLGRGGLVVIDATSGQRLQADAQYAGAVGFVHHAADGRLATASSDGCLRVYANDGQLVHRNQYPPKPAHEPQCTGDELGGVRFSPDGRWIALGIRSRAEVYLFDAQRVALVRTLRVDNADQRSLCCIAWSPGGRTLWINGTIDGDAPTPLYRIGDPERPQPVRMNVGRQQFSNMLPMPDGSIVFATTVPSLTRLGADGTPMRRDDGTPMTIAPDNVDFHRTRRRLDAFRLSADGLSVAFEAAPGQWWQLEPLADDAEAALRAIAAPPATMTPARRQGAVSVQTATGLFAHRSPTSVNGHRIAFAEEEGVRSWAVHPRLKAAAFGTQWRLHLVDERGAPMPGWEQPAFLPAPAWHVAISEDARWIVAALGDGTLQWYPVGRAAPRLSAFVHANGRDWVAWRPDGFYASSARGDAYIGWLVNRGATRSPELVRAVQLERTLYRPDLLKVSLRETTMSGPSLRQALASLAPPRVSVESVRQDDAGTLTVRFVAEAGARPIGEIGVFVDGLPVLAVDQRRLAPDERQRVGRTVTVPLLQAGEHRVRVEAESEVSLGSDETLALRPTRATAPPRGDLWVVAVGAQRFDRVPQLRPLPFATNDAQEVARVFSTQRGRAFADVRVQVLSETSGTAPTKSAVLAALRTLEGMRPQDTAVVFFASHGTTDGADYYVMPKDADPQQVMRLMTAQDQRKRLARADATSLLAGSEIIEALRRLPGRRILVLDTCHAGALGSSNPYALVKRSASSQVGIVSAARGDESSFDSPNRPHGAFTDAFLEALRSPPSVAEGVTLRMAFDDAVPKVQDVVRALRSMARGPEATGIHQTPLLLGPPALERTVLATKQQ